MMHLHLHIAVDIKILISDEVEFISLTNVM